MFWHNKREPVFNYWAGRTREESIHFALSLLTCWQEGTRTFVGFLEIVTRVLREFRWNWPDDETRRGQRIQCTIFISIRSGRSALNNKLLQVIFHTWMILVIFGNSATFCLSTPWNTIIMNSVANFIPTSSLYARLGMRAGTSNKIMYASFFYVPPPPRQEVMVQGQCTWACSSCCSGVQEKQRVYLRGQDA